MKYKKSMIILILTIFLFAIAAASASDVNETVTANEDTGQLELSVNDETLSSEANSEILDAGQYTYSDLRDQIGSGGNITLTEGNYTYYNGDGDTIKISNPGVIDGNGAIIDMAGSTIQAFYVNVSSVTIKNLTIKNVNYTGKGGAIYFAQSGSAINCNFADNKASGNGGAVYFAYGSTGNVINCNFTNNSARYGGAIDYESTGTITNCYFTNNSVTGDNSFGGAIYMNSGNVLNCNLPYTNINNIKSQKISAKTSNKPQQLILKRAITEEHFLPLNNYNIQLEIISLVLKIKCSSVLPILTQI